VEGDNDKKWAIAACVAQNVALVCALLIVGCVLIYLGHPTLGKGVIIAGVVGAFLA